ncbi:DUF4138 domain-containing protein [Aestuariivivens insulae]|uniref:DUF4138 domain-containing protein n=1 Tax=Aestuariivivens insulae TaxID=1621988 RepID=UPI001F57F4AA|nr:DUF4138 domain-containing protein [Aestuariivivens insulae]
MKTLITFLLLVLVQTTFAQKTLDTLYANEHKNVALFFPKPIRQGITGNTNFVFTYNREKEQHFGLLKATPGKESNLLAITNDGQIYSYILKYAHKLPKLNYFIGTRASIGNERPKPIKVVPDAIPLKDSISQIAHYQKFCAYLLRSDKGNLVTKRKKGIKLRLEKMVYNGSEVYLVLNVQNQSGIDFEIDYLDVFKINGNSGRKASFQKLWQEVLYKHRRPAVVKVGQSKRFVYVLPKFVLGVNEKLQLELWELKGNRKVNLVKH